jgi:LysR family transcriptional regulator, carnitine catabolism transcriptional activator
MEFTSRQLRAFHLVAHHLSFARAAEHLFITASGLSVLIRELERQVGFRLFDRTTRHVTLTPEGRELLAATSSALANVDQAVAGIEEREKGKERFIRVGSTPWFAANVLPTAIREFRQMRMERSALSVVRSPLANSTSRSAFLKNPLACAALRSSAFR